jgi:hypothetical protein
MNWRIESRTMGVIDVDNITQEKYIVYVFDDANSPIEATEAHGIEECVHKIRAYTVKYGKYIVNIEHK